MYACDTNEIPAICKEHLRHLPDVHTSDADMISQLIGFFKKMSAGNGRLLLYISRGLIQKFEPTSEIPNKKRSA